MATTTSTSTESSDRRGTSTEQGSVEIRAPISKPQTRRNSSSSEDSSQRKDSTDSTSSGQTAHPPATSVLLQGNARSAKKLLWLFPDGSGCAAPYTTLEPLTGEVAVVALQCPYMRSAENWNCGPKQLTYRYVEEIRKKQPEGPYYLGGWSTGGILAFEAAQELHSAEDKVKRIFLIDTPCPIHRKWRPSSLIEDLKDIISRERKGKQLPEWMHRHYDASLRSLKKYRVRPFEPYQEPATNLIYAGRGVCEHLPLPQFTDLDDDEPEEVKFIVSERQSFDSGGWERLLDPEGIQVNVIEDADHFSILKGDDGKQLSELISESLA